MKNKLHKISNEWDHTYKKLKHDDFLWSDTPEVEDFILFAKREGAIKILDAGCGDGKNLTSLVRESQFYCIGCDGSHSALNICDKQIIKRNYKFIERSILREKELYKYCLIKSKIENMPFYDNYFDACVCIDVINHNRNPYPIFYELERVVKPSGLIYFSLFNIEDEIIRNCKQKKNMKQLIGGIKDREYIYEFKNTDSQVTKYYYRFLKEDEINEFLSPTKFVIIHDKVKIWKNPPHPHFRPYEHQHCNHMVLVRNAK